MYYPPLFKTNFTPSDGIDLGEKLISKNYLLSSYPNLLDSISASSLFTWGYNSGGSMGGNGTSNSPIQLGTDTNWSLVAYNSDSVAATKTTGTLWTWGYNNNGQLGQNNLVYRSSPTQVGTGTGWLKVAISERYTIMGISGDPLS